MNSRVTIQSGSPRPAIEARLLALASPGPFRVRDLTPLGGDAWAFTLEPARPAIAVGFAKVAEFVLLLAREFEVTNVVRGPLEAIAAAG